MPCPTMPPGGGIVSTGSPNAYVESQAANCCEKSEKSQTKTVMGVGTHSAIHLCKLSRSFYFGGDLLTLGVQDTELTEDRLRRMALQYSLPNPPKDWKPEINEREPYRSKDFLTGASFWSYLGFKSVTTLDVDDYEGASEITDLNKLDLPASLCDRFHFVFDGGTIEHLFNLPNALLNLHRMTKVGGMIIHQTPSLPLIDHGFYMFSPTFFYDYYSANRYEIVDLQIVMYSRDSVREPCWFTDYSPGSLGWISNRGYCFPGMNFLILGCFRRLAESTGGVVPQQGAYVKHWEVAMERKRALKNAPEAGEDDEEEQQQMVP